MRVAIGKMKLRITSKRGRNLWTFFNEHVIDSCETSNKEVEEWENKMFRRDIREFYRQLKWPLSQGL